MGYNVDRLRYKEEKQQLHNNIQNLLAENRQLKETIAQLEAKVKQLETKKSSTKRKTSKRKPANKSK